MPSHVRDVGRQKGTFDNRSGPAQFHDLSHFNAFNIGAPWLFWEAFRLLSDAELYWVSTGGVFLGLAYILLDHLVDGQTANPGSAVLLEQALYWQAIRNFTEVFPGNDPFWVEFERLSNKLLNSLALEREASLNPAIYSLEVFRETAAGKASPPVITLSAASRLVGETEILTSGEISMVELLTAGQLGHDVSEWQDDLAAGHLTYFLSCCAPAERWSSASGQNPSWPTQVEIENRIATGWLDAEHYKLSRSWLELASRHATRLKCSGWNAYAEYYLELAQKSIETAVAGRILSIIT